MQRAAELTNADIERVLAVLRAGTFDHVELEVDGVRIVASNRPLQGRASTLPATDHPAPVVPPARAAPVVQPTDAPPEHREIRPPSDPPTADSPDVVAAPMAGIFYQRPSPDSPPFLDVGEFAPAGETIGLIEVMKLFTAIKADVSGVIAEFLAADGEQVVKGQPLIRLEAQQPA